MKKVRLLLNGNGVLRVFDSSEDINEQILEFVNEETFGVLSEIDYYEGGKFTIDKGNDDIEYYITFTGDNGILEMTTKIFDVL